MIEVHEQWAGIADMINIIANTAFVFLPALIGWSAVKRFGGSEILGVVLGLILVHPDLLNAWAYGDALAKGSIPTWNLFGFEINKIGYQGQVLPVLFASWILAKIEIGLRKRVIDSLQLLVVAPIALLVTGVLTFIIIGPITFTIGNLVTDGLVAVFDSYALIGGLVYGAIYGTFSYYGHAPYVLGSRFTVNRKHWSDILMADIGFIKYRPRICGVCDDACNKR